MIEKRPVMFAFLLFLTCGFAGILRIFSSHLNRRI